MEQLDDKEMKELMKKLEELMKDPEKESTIDMTEQFEQKTRISRKNWNACWNSLKNSGRS
jgi:hypothetical protein